MVYLKGMPISGTEGRRDKTREKRERQKDRKTERQRDREKRHRESGKQ
jgi:hypothetical protein